MPIRFKVNERIKIKSLKDFGFIFQVDLKQEAHFRAGNQELFNNLFDFVNHGYINSNNKTMSAENKFRYEKFISDLIKNNFINYEIELNDAIAIVKPKSQEFVKCLEWNNTFRFDKGLYGLSRFVYMHCKRANFTLESPVAHFQIILSQKLFPQLIPLFNGSLKLCDFVHSYEGYEEEIAFLLRLLIQGEFLHPADYQEPKSLSSWEFHDLLFHVSSRLGRAKY